MWLLNDVCWFFLLEWFIADGPVLLSELSKLLKYDGRKKEEARKKQDRQEKIDFGLNLHNYKREEPNEADALAAVALLMQAFKNNAETLI